MIKPVKLFSVLAIAIVAIGSIGFASIAYGAQDPNLILHWNLNEGSGTTALDASGNSYDGTLYNGASYVPGHEGTGASLDGVDQYVQTPTPFGFLGTANQEYALSAWVNLPQTGQSGNIFHISDQIDGSGWCIPFLTLTNGHFAATGWDQNGQVSAVDPAVASSDHWYQVISTWDAANGLRLFVDGTLVSSTPQADYAASGSPMYASLGLGNASCSNDQGYLAGVVDDARIYSRALLSSDVEAIAGEGVVTPPAVLAVDTTPLVPGVPNTGSKPEGSMMPVLVSGMGFTGLLMYGLFRRFRKQ